MSSGWPGSSSAAAFPSAEARPAAVGLVSTVGLPSTVALAPAAAFAPAARASSLPSCPALAGDVSTCDAACGSTASPAASGPGRSGAEGAKAEHKAEFDHINAFNGDAARGERIAADKQLSGTGQACIDCHGPGGAKPIDVTYPVLAGQYQDYIFHAIRQYRDGGREHAQFTNQIKGAADDRQRD